MNLTRLRERHTDDREQKQPQKPLTTRQVRQLLEEAGYAIEDEKARAPDIQKAKRLLEEAGYLVEEPADDDDITD
jgi:ABC-type transport system substrate-binding protein